MVFSATFNNISVISWRSILLMEEAEGEPLTCNKAKALLNLNIGYFDLYVLELLFSETAKLFESKLG